MIASPQTFSTDGLIGITISSKDAAAMFLGFVMLFFGYVGVSFTLAFARMPLYTIPLEGRADGLSEFAGPLKTCSLSIFEPWVSGCCSQIKNARLRGIVPLVVKIGCPQPGMS